jgi:signal peptidase I
MRRVARAVLTMAVRGRRERGGPWGEAVLSEFDQTTGRWESVRWAAGGLHTVWRERRARVRELPRRARIQRAIMATAALGLLASFAVNQFALSARYVASGSMEPTLPVAGRFLLDKVSYQVTGIDRGDIVEFAIPDSPTHKAIKRVIGLPGDVIECKAGRVYRDGVALDEPYVEVDDPGGTGTEDCGAPVTVPPDRLFVLGDHRAVSRDSRHWGTIAQSTVDGRLLATFGPVDWSLGTAGVTVG